MTEGPELREVVETLLSNRGQPSATARLEAATRGHWSKSIRKRGLRDNSPLPAPALILLTLITLGIATLTTQVIERRRQTDMEITIHASDGDLKHRSKIRGHVPDEDATETACRKLINEALQLATMTPHQARAAAKRRGRRRHWWSGIALTLAIAYIAAMIAASKAFGY